MVVKNLVHVTKYTDKQYVEKKKYQKVGTLFMYDDGGMSVKLDYIPVGFTGDLAVYASEPKVKTMSEKKKEELDQVVKELKQEKIPF